MTMWQHVRNRGGARAGHGSAHEKTYVYLKYRQVAQRAASWNAANALLGDAAFARRAQCFTAW